MNDDAQEIRRMLEDSIEQVLDAIAPGWVQRGGVAYLTPKNAKDLGSYTVHLKNGGRMPRGTFYRFSQAVGGGSVELVAYHLYGRKDAYREAFAWARDFLGIARHQETGEERAGRERRSAEEAAARDRRRAIEATQSARTKEKRVQAAQEIWAECLPLVGTHGDAYLQARSIPPVAEWPWDPVDAIRFHPDLAYPGSGSFPAIVARVQDPWGSTVSVWRIYLDRALPAKAPVEDPKKGLGPAQGGAVRIGGDGPKIGIGEGLETCLAAWVLEGYRYPVWAGLSTSGVQGFEPPLDVQRVHIFPDGDYAIMSKQGHVSEPPGISAAKKLRDRLVPSGIKTVINEVCIHGDVLDLLVTMRDYEQRQV